MFVLVISEVSGYTYALPVHIVGTHNNMAVVYNYKSQSTC